MSEEKITQALGDVRKYIMCDHEWTMGDRAWLRAKAGTKRRCPRCGVTETIFHVDGERQGCNLGNENLKKECRKWLHLQFPGGQF